MKVGAGRSLGLRRAAVSWRSRGDRMDGRPWGGRWAGLTSRADMNDVPEKTRHAVEMATTARALARVAPTAHRKRGIGRYVFVYLHDVVRFAPAWRNALRADPRTRP